MCSSLSKAPMPTQPKNSRILAMSVGFQLPFECAHPSRTKAPMPTEPKNSRILAMSVGCPDTPGAHAGRCKREIRGPVGGGVEMVLRKQRKTFPGKKNRLPAVSLAKEKIKKRGAERGGPRRRRSIH
ncbi:hypothetical protein CDAR_241291 [Caerostris darwini]|uniref:Uncharacterized protein n=1 Tax=Caerostris darwini TaxID=1538125 RepID=A0AAV4TFL6_9ARAC|nr:hypothetical protein CDAR_241291 [Caerostris darwini]